MANLFPYLAEEVIERDAATLLAEFAQARGVVITPPIPIEDIVEKHLRLGIEFDDTHKRFGIPRSGLGFKPDILGAIFFNERRILLDESLDPEENRTMEGRYRFTLAHEGGGHWRLHRHLFLKDPAQAALFDGPTAPSIVCRSSQAKHRAEWQADFYASCLLMPRKLVFDTLEDMFMDFRKGVLQPRNPTSYAFLQVRRTINRTSGREGAESADNVQDEIAWSLAEIFLVSPLAMRIRLEKLGVRSSQGSLQDVLT